MTTQIPELVDRAIQSARHERWIEAVADLETAIELQRRATIVDPLNAVNHHNLTSYLSAAGYYNEAIKSNRRMLNLSPKSLVKIGEQLAHCIYCRGGTRTL